MNLTFFIQPSNPVMVDPYPPIEETLSDAIEALFPLDTEFAFVVWSGIFIPIGYKYDVSEMIEDIIAIVGWCNQGEPGPLEIHWPSQSFAAVWRLTLHADEVEVKSEWRDVIGSVADLLKQRSIIRVPTAQFVTEWMKLLRLVEGRISPVSWIENARGYDGLKQLLVERKL